MRRAFTACVLAGGMVLATSLPAMAGSATIQGTITNGTAKGPASGVKVTLSKGNAETGPAGEETDRTDRRGGFRFSGLEGGEPWQYDVSVEHDSALYISDALIPEDAETLNTDLEIWDTTTSTKNVTTTSWTIFFDPDPAGVAMQQDLIYDNTGDETYISDKQSDPTARPVTVLPLLPGTDTENIQVDGIYLSPVFGSASIEDAWAHAAPLLPGTSTATMRAVSPIPTQPATIGTQFQTKELTFLVHPDLTVESPQLQASGTQEVEGTTYDAYKATDLVAGTAITVSFGGGSGSSDGDTTKVVGVILLAVALLGGLFLVVVRLRNPQMAARNAKAKSTPPASRKGKPAASRPEDVDSDLLVAEIAALDLSFEQGNIDEADYRKLREARKAELKRARQGGSR